MARNSSSRRRGGRRRQRAGAPRTAAPLTPRPTRGSAAEHPAAKTTEPSEPDQQPDQPTASSGGAALSGLPARPRRQIQAQAPTTEDAPRVRGLLYRLLRPRWLLGIIDELRKVVWPSRQETGNLTVVVLVVAIAMGVFLGAIDFGLNRVVENTLLP